MKKMTCLGLSMIMTLGLLTACGDDPATSEGTGSQSQQQEQQETTSITGVVNTDGSTSMADVMAVLQETFKSEQPNVTVNYTGSSPASRFSTPVPVPAPASPTCSTAPWTSAFPPVP